MKLFKKADHIKIYGFLTGAVFVLAALVLLLLSYYAVTGSWLSRDYMGLVSSFMPDKALTHILIAVVILIAFTCGNYIWKKFFSKHEKKAESVVLILTSILMLLAGTKFMVHHPYYPIGDQVNTFFGGVYAAKEGFEYRYAMFAPGGYFGIYPQQKGLAFFYMTMYKVFGDDLLPIMELFHLIYPQIILYAGFGALRKEKVPSFGRVFFCVLMISCIPIYLYIPYMYGDLPSIAFSFCCMYFIAAFLESGRLRHAAGICVFAALAVFVRMQIWIFVIAVLITLLLEAIKRKKLKYAVTAVCVILSCFIATSSVQRYYDSVSGYGHVDGVPSLCWVAMGLQMSGNNPGVYNRYNQGSFESNGFDADKTAQDAKEDIKNSIAEMKASRDYTLSFFALKLRQEWTEPDFNGYFETGVFWNYKSGTFESETPAWLTSLYSGELCIKAINFMNYYQSAVYLLCLAFALICLFGKHSKATAVSVMSLIYLIGGFLFFLVWENKSRYILPFFMCLVWCVPVAACEVSNALSRAKKSFKGQKN